MAFSGRCLCRAVTYRVDAEPKWVIHCHCESCRRHTSSAVATFVGVDADAVSWTGVIPARYESSPKTWRCFCAGCGSPVAYESVRFPGEIHLYVGTLDHPEDRAARAHVFVSEQLPWFEVLDDCTRYEFAGSKDGKPLRRGPRPPHGHGAT